MTWAIMTTKGNGISTEVACEARILTPGDASTATVGGARERGGGAEEGRGGGRAGSGGKWIRGEIDGDGGEVVGGAEGRAQVTKVCWTLICRVVVVLLLLLLLQASTTCIVVLKAAVCRTLFSRVVSLRACCARTPL